MPPFLLTTTCTPLLLCFPPFESLSHCDPGWLSTFEQYYANDVRRILGSVVDELLNDPKKTFIWAETSFFNKWYETVALSKRKEFRKLVTDGRFEFVGGGWSQNDEANPDPMSVVNQVTQVRLSGLCSSLIIPHQL